MLRAERNNRRITHPHASYTKDGKLLCNLCETLVKSEAQWQSHLHSTQHVLRSQRAQGAKDSRKTVDAGGGKKRKAESLDSPRVDNERKRARPSEEEVTVEEDVDDTWNGVEVEEEAAPRSKAVKVDQTISTANRTIQPAPTQNAPLIDDSEFAAFEADLLAASTAPASAPSALQAEATISAPALSAEELAAQAREEQSAQRGKRDQEIEEEREDAARAMEEEFEEMEGLEERVRRLRERREALRVISPEVEGGGAREAMENGVVEEEDISDSEEDDTWGFGGS